MNIFIAVLEDRHTDVDIIVCKSYKKAQSQIIEWKKHYGDKQVWSQTEITGWRFFCDGGEDGPTLRIEEKELME